MKNFVLEELRDLSHSTPIPLSDLVIFFRKHNWNYDLLTYCVGVLEKKYLSEGLYVVEIFQDFMKKYWDEKIKPTLESAWVTILEVVADRTDLYLDINFYTTVSLSKDDGFIVEDVDSQIWRYLYWMDNHSFVSEYVHDLEDGRSFSEKHGFCSTWFDHTSFVKSLENLTDPFWNLNSLLKFAAFFLKWAPGASNPRPSVEESLRLIKRQLFSPEKISFSGEKETPPAQNVSFDIETANVSSPSSFHIFLTPEGNVISENNFFRIEEGFPLINYNVSGVSFSQERPLSFTRLDEDSEEET